MTTTTGDVFEAIKRQRISLASSIVAAIALIGVVHAPVVPIVAGCFVALTYLVLRSRAKLLSIKGNR